MTPFIQIPVNVQRIETRHRQMLESLPDELLSDEFGGRLPGRMEKLQWIEEKAKGANPERLFRNDTYMVGVHREPPFIRLVIYRHDGGTCKSWRDFQQIKNELVGREHEAVELFPAESRLVDTTNQYHLFVCENPRFRFPMGRSSRVVAAEPVTIGGRKSDTPEVRLGRAAQTSQDRAGLVCSTQGCSVRVG